MAAATYTDQNLTVARRGVKWGAVWAGVFIFAAIESVFGMLAVAIFVTPVNPAAVHPITGISVGASIWAIVLTVIAMYAAGLISGRLAEVSTRNEGAAHGQAMFGLSVVGVLLLTLLAGVGMAAGAAAESPVAHVVNALAGIGWATFIALILGWLGAMIGGSMAVPQRRDATVQPIRNAAA
jgi:MFS family permease